MKKLLLFLMLALVLSPGLLSAADPDDTNTRLRDALRDAYTKLADAQNQNADLQAAKADSDRQNTALKTSVQTLTDQLKALNTKATLVLQNAQAQIDQLKLQNALTQRQADDLKERNRALFTLGGEILTRYEKLGLGEALEAREPFTGLARVKLENLVQGYEDKLVARKDGVSPAPSTASTSSPTPKP